MNLKTKIKNFLHNQKLENRFIIYIFPSKFSQKLTFKLIRARKKIKDALNR